MVAINLGSATTTVFSTTAQTDIIAPATGPLLTGAHTFKIWADSVLYLASAPANAFVAGSTLGSSASWTIDIDGTITGFDNGETSSLPSTGINLLTSTATTAHKVNVGTEGSIYASGLGIVVNSAADIVNRGVIHADIDSLTSMGILFNYTPTGLGPTRLVSVKNELSAEILGGQFAVYNDSLATLTVTNAGVIYSETDIGQSGGAVVSDGTLRLTNNANSIIEGGVRSDWITSTVVNNGQIFGGIDADISGTYWLAMSISGTGVKVGHIDLNRDGDMTDAGESINGAVYNTLGMSVTNTGLIEGTTGISADSIRGGNDAVVGSNQVAFDGTVGRDSISNSGTAVIWGDLGMGMGNDTISNSGLVIGNIDLGVLDDLIGDVVDQSNGGSMTFNGSTIALPTDGNDTLSNTGTGSIYGSVFAGSGNDTITNAGFINRGSSNGIAVDLGSGDDRLINSGRIIGDANMGAGNDAVTISGTLGDTPTTSGQFDVYGGDGNDTVSIAATGRVDDVFAGNGNDNVTINGFADNIWLDRQGTGNASFDSLQGAGSTIADGDDRLFIGTTGFVQGSIYLGNGDAVAAAANAADQVMSNAGIVVTDTLATSIAGANVGIAFGTGADSLSNTTTGQIFTTGIVMGDGNDTVTNAGQMHIVRVDNNATTAYLSLGNGDDRFVNTGTVGNFLSTTGGVFFYETMGASSNLYASFELNDADDNPLTYYRVAVDAGDGTDVVTATGRIFGFVEMGAGNDSFLGGVHNDFAIDGQGVDVMNMGAGADYIFVRGQATYDGADTFNGGDGIDLIQFAADTVNGSLGVSVDLNARTVIYEHVNGVGSDAANGVDSIVGFEQVIGTDRADSIYGSAAAETLDGGAGNDTLSGRGGKDVLIGGNGADQFVFTVTGDSGKTRATRDVIADFDLEDGDKIRFLFDGNGGTTSEPGATSFAVGLIENGTFDPDGAGALLGTPGQLRTIIQGGNTVVELDINGDGRVDFAVELRGVVDLSMSDFLFT